MIIRPLLALKDIKKQYGDFLVDVSFGLAGDSLLSIIGPSGSGKTSTLRLIAGFDFPDSGSVVLDGSDITRQQPWIRRFGYVPQNMVLFPHLNVCGNVSYGLKMQKKSKPEIRARVEELLKIVGLEGFENRSVESLSGGEKQRVALARSLAPAPEILLLDEPFSSLDAPLRKEMRQEVLAIRESLGVSVILVTHDQEEALSVSDWVVVLSGGKIVQRGTPEEIYRRPANIFVARFVGTTNIVPARRTDNGRNWVIGGNTIPGASVTCNVSEEARSGAAVIRPLHFGGHGSDPGIRGLIKQRRYTGVSYEYLCETDYGDLVVVDNAKLESGEAVVLTFDPAHVAIVN